MFHVEEVIRNNKVEEVEVSVERMIDARDRVIYSDHRGIIFAHLKETGIENKIQSESEDKQHRY